MKREKKRRGSAGSGSGLFGGNARLLAAALFLAALVNGGGAIGGENDLGGKAKTQDADPEVIQLDGPIQPSSVLTTEGVVIILYQ